MEIQHLSVFGDEKNKSHKNIFDKVLDTLEFG